MDASLTRRRPTAPEGPPSIDNPALLQDYLFIGPLIEQRLREQLPDMPVDVCETVEQVLAADQRTQVLMVMWAGERFGDRAADGRAQKLRQTWVVILGLNFVGKTAPTRYQKASPLLTLVHRALAGWTPEGACAPLVPVNTGLRPDINRNKALYPLGFEIDVSLRAKEHDVAQGFSGVGLVSSRAPTAEYASSARNGVATLERRA